jgi:hypothetical protein
MRNVYKKVLPLALLCWWPALVTADQAAPDIEYLLTTLGQSDCTFIRNGKEHSATEAESHLRMKYERGRKYVDSADQFIDQLASKSSWSGKPYYIQCPGEDQQQTSAWLTQRLAQYSAGE